MRTGLEVSISLRACRSSCIPHSYSLTSTFARPRESHAGARVLCLHCAEAPATRAPPQTLSVRPVINEWFRMQDQLYCSFFSPFIDSTGSLRSLTRTSGFRHCSIQAPTSFICCQLRICTRTIVPQTDPCTPCRLSSLLGPINLTLRAKQWFSKSMGIVVKFTVAFSRM